MTPYIKDFEVFTHDVDQRGIARPSSILRYLQEAASHQMLACKPSYEDLFKDHKAFILSRIAVTVNKPLYRYEKLRVSTWPCESKGVTFHRCYQIVRDGEIVVTASSKWGLVNPITHAFIKISEVDFSNYAYNEPIDQENLSFRIPKEDLILCGAHTVRYAETDQNCHMNNTNYPDIFSDCLDEKKDCYVSSFAIHYATEAVEGDTFSIYRSSLKKEQDEHVYYMQGRIGHKVCTNARFGLTKVKN